jgi:dihydroneopterin aldolase
MIGVNPEEALKPQSVMINAEITLKNSVLPKSDQINDVLSYDDIVQGIRSISQSKHFNLVESFIEETSDLISSYSEVSDYLIRVEKIDIYDDIAGVGVEITR